MVDVALVGVGYWGPNLLRVLSQIEGVTVRTICDLSAERLRKVRTSHPLARVTGAYEDVVADPEIDAVVLATPVQVHYQQARLALEWGKHVLVEKPLAGSTVEALELAELAEVRERVLMVGHTFLYHQAVRQVRSYLETGTIGDVYYIYSQRLNLGRVRDSVDVLWNLAPHDVSIILYWLGASPTSVSARGLEFLQPGRNLADIVFVLMNFDDGRSAHLHLSWLDPLKVRRMTLVGSKKMIVFDDVSSDEKIRIFDRGFDRPPRYQELGEYSDFGAYQLLHRAGDILVPRVAYKEPLLVECREFVECISTGARPLANATNGFEVVRVLEAATESMKRSGEEVRIG